MVRLGCIKSDFCTSLRGRSPKQSNENKQSGLLRQTARNDGFDF